MGNQSKPLRSAPGASVAVIYLRVSTEDQARGMSLDSQEAICRSYCERERISVDRIFVDRGVSAKTDARPDFQAMVTYCRQSGGRVTHVVIYKLDRFSREARHTLVYRALLASVGVRLASATENLSDDPAGRLLGTILAGMNEYDNDCKAQRVRDNMRHLQEAGYWTHQPPFGYQIVRVDERPTLVPHAVTGPALQEAFRRMADRSWTPAEAAQHLAAAGHHVSESRFYELIRSPIYAGIISTSLTSRPAEMRGEPLVDLDTFTAANEVIGSSTRRLAVEADAYPLRGVLLCPTCRGRLTASSSRGRSSVYAYYHCRHGHVRHREDATNVRFGEVLSAISSSCGVLMAAVKALALRLWDADESANREAASAAAEQAERIAAKRKRLLDAMLSGAVDQATYTATDRELRAAVVVVESRSAHLDRHEMRAIIDKAASVLNDLTIMWNRMNHQQRRAFAACLFPAGLIWGDDVCRTAVSSSRFNALRLAGSTDLRMASPTGGQPNRDQIADLIASLKPILEFAA